MSANARGEDASAAPAPEPAVQEPPKPKTSPRSAKLLDDRYMTNGAFLTLGPIWWRKAEDNTPAENRRNFEHGTGEISVGQVTTTSRGPFYSGGSLRTIFRILDSKRFSWSIFHEDISSGVRLGPIEPEISVGASLISLDVMRAEWSAQLFSPRVSAGLGLHLGKIKVDVKAHAEYLWRWFGPDYFIRGVTLGIGLDVRPKRMFREDPEQPR
jgi:hypothetical protein